MRLARPIAVVLAACVCFAGAARAAPTVKLRVAFHPAVAGQQTTIELALRISGPGGAPSPPVRSLGLRLPANMGLAGTTLGQANCDPANLLVLGLKGCSGNARIGFGSASAVVPVGSQSLHEKASLDALLGPPAEDRLEVLWYVQATEPVFAQLVLPSVVEEAASPYGEELATTVPLVQVWPEGPDLALETFKSTIGPLDLTYFHEVAGKTVPYHPRGIRIPRTCPPSGYQFAADLHFEDGSQTTAVYHVRCPRSR